MARHQSIEVLIRRRAWPLHALAWFLAAIAKLARIPIPRAVVRLGWTTRIVRA